MSVYTEFAHQHCPLVGIVLPSLRSSGNYPSNAIDFSKMRQLYAVVSSGLTISGNGTVDFAWQYCTTSNGTFSNLNAAWKITQITSSGYQETLVLRQEAVPQQISGAQAKFIRGMLTIGGSLSTEAAAYIFATNLWNSPPSGIAETACQLSTVLHNNVFINP